MRFRAALDIVDRCLTVAASGVELDFCRRTIWEDQTDWLAVVALANQHLVVPALWTAFIRYDVHHQLPNDVRDYLSLIHVRNADRNDKIRKQCVEIGQILSEAGLQAVLLKGAAWLFDGSLEAAADRMMRDIDLLLPDDKVEVAVRALVGSGYEDSGESLLKAGWYHYAPLLPLSGVARVEIHRDLAHRVDLLPASEVIVSARAVAPGLSLPSAEHRIAHNVVHAQIVNGDFVGGTVSLRDTLDLARLVNRYGTKVDWVYLAKEARRRGFLRHLSGAVRISHRVLQSQLPPPLADFRGKVHASRSIYQRRWPLISKSAEKLGFVVTALAWDRDAYPLRLGTDRSLRAQFLVNRRRAQRARGALERTGWHSLVLHRHARRALERQLTYQHAKAQNAHIRTVRKLAVSTSERTPVLLDWPASNVYAWGIAGLNTFMAWANDRDLQPLMGAPITEDSLAGYAPERVRALEATIAESNQFQSNLARFRAGAMRMEMPIVKAFGNGLDDPGGVIGTPNIGRCVFEDTRLEKLDDKLANCDVVLCASRWNADLLRTKTPKRVEVIHEGIDNTLFRPGPRPGLLDTSKFYIFSGGKVEYRKGHDLVLLAFKEFSRRHDDAVLVTAWHSPWPQISAGFKGKLNAPLELAADGTIHVKKWVASNGINPDKVIEIKQIPNLLMPGVLCDMDCAVFPSRAEAGTSLPAKEAMACGIPVILAANTGLEDVIDGSNCIALTKQKPIHDFTERGMEQWGESDVEEIVQALERLYADSWYRRKMGRDGAAWILAQGRTWTNHAQQLKSLIMSL